MTLANTRFSVDTLGDDTELLKTGLSRETEIFLTGRQILRTIEFVELLIFTRIMYFKLYSLLLAAVSAEVCRSCNLTGFTFTNNL
jgi:hypothetical protein